MSTQATSPEAPQAPLQDTEFTPPKFWEWGWNRSAEIWNGRVAMLVFLVFVLGAWTLS